MLPDERVIKLGIDGLGIICYSPANAAHIQPGENYLRQHYKSVDAVQSHLQQGSIIGFGTGSPGKFILHIRGGYPEPAEVEQHPFRLRLGVRCVGETLVFRDIYSLIGWEPEYDPEQSLSLPDGDYHLTLLTSCPASGVFGDQQVILVYLKKLPTFPPVLVKGIPTLCA